MARVNHLEGGRLFEGVFVIHGGALFIAKIAVRPDRKLKKFRLREVERHPIITLYRTDASATVIDNNIPHLPLPRLIFIVYFHLIVVVLFG